MDYRKLFLVEPGKRLKLAKMDPGYCGKDVSEKDAKAEIEKCCGKLNKLQYLLFAEATRSLLIVLQAMDAGGKDGTVQHVMGAMNPAGTSVTSFKQPTAEDLRHDFLVAGASLCACQGHGCGLQPLPLRGRTGGARA